MLKRIIPLILVLMILGVGVFYLLSTEREESRNLEELYRQTEPLQRQKDELTARKVELAEDFRLETRDISTVQILFRESSVKLFTDVYPLMRDRGITGVIGLSLEDYPGIGIKDKISLEHYNRLIMDGWGSCLVYDGNATLENYLINMNIFLGKNGIPLPSSIYFSEKRNPYDPAMDEILFKYGIDTIIRNASDGHSDTVSPVGEVWRIGAMPWNYTGINTDLELLATTDGGNLMLTASFKDIWDGMMQEVPPTNANRNPDPIVQQAFISFLDVLTAMLDKEVSMLSATPTPYRTPTPDPNAPIADTQLLLHVTDIPTAREAHLRAQNTNENSYAEYQRMQDELDAQIASLEQQIADIYRAFNINQVSVQSSD